MFCYVTYVMLIGPCKQWNVSKENDVCGLQNRAKWPFGTDEQTGFADMRAMLPITKIISEITLFL